MILGTVARRAVEDVLRRHPIAGGAAIGLMWGAAMRVWMRFISPHPEFTWSGTLFILAGSVIVGTLLGLAHWRRSVGGAGWWRLSALSLMLLGAGGAVMWPSVILGAVAFGQWRYRLLRLLLVPAALIQVPVLQGVFADNWRMSGSAMVVAVVWYLPMITLEAWGFSVCVSPATAIATEGGRLRRIVVAAALIAVGGFGLLVAGLVGG